MVPGRSDLPVLFLRSEGVVLLGVATFLFARQDASWLLFAVLLLVPDVGIAAYLGGTRFGAWAYNVLHTTVLPGLLVVVGLVAESQLAVSVALIWLAHIGMDRALGFGLKYPSDFRDTHLGRMAGGRARGPQASSAD